MNLCMKKLRILNSRKLRSLNLIEEKPLEREVFCFGQLGDDIYFMYQVYLISSNNQQGKRYKIGYTRNDVSKRIKQLKTGNSGSKPYTFMYFAV